MGIDVIVITNGSEMGEKLLKLTWHVAQKLFHEYGVEVFVIPYQVRRGRISLVINGVEYPVKRIPSLNELLDLILTAASDEGKEVGEILLGSVIDTDGTFGNGALAIT